MHSKKLTFWPHPFADICDVIAGKLPSSSELFCVLKSVFNNKGTKMTNEWIFMFSFFKQIVCLENRIRGKTDSWFSMTPLVSCKAGLGLRLRYRPEPLFRVNSWLLPQIAYFSCGLVVLKNPQNCFCNGICAYDHCLGGVAQTGAKYHTLVPSHTCAMRPQLVLYVCYSYV